MRAEVDFDHHDEAFAADPWSVYRGLQERCPVAHTESYGGFWVLSRYQDVRAATLRPSTFSSAMDDLLIPPQDGGRLLPVQCDPPLVGQYRRLLLPYFSTEAVNRMEADMRRITRETLGHVKAMGTFDVVADLANVVPGKVTTLLVGWEEAAWADIVPPIRAYSGARPGDDDLDEATAQILALRRRVEDEIAANRASAGRGLVADLVRAGIDGRALDDTEITSLVMMVLFGGVDTTVSAIGNALVRLDEDRSLREELRANREQIPAAVDELLRIDSPVTGFARRVTHNAIVDDQQMRAGEVALLLWASANRDPAEFPEPDTIRLDRGPARHLSFGAGQHKCLGATLARVELAVVIDEVLNQIPDYRIDHHAMRWQRSNGTVYARAAIPAAVAP